MVDPGVLVSAAISSRGAPRRLLEAWHAGRFEMLASYDRLYELEAVLMRPRFRSRLLYSDVVEYVMWIRERSVFVREALAEVELSPDPDEDYLIALAFEPGADYLVSQDRLHLLDPDFPVGPFRIVHPREFLDVEVGVWSGRSLHRDRPFCYRYDFPLSRSPATYTPDRASVAGGASLVRLTRCYDGP